LAFRAAKLLEILTKSADGRFDVGLRLREGLFLLLDVLQDRFDGVEIGSGHLELGLEFALYDHVLNLLLLAEEQLDLSLHLANVAIDTTCLLHIAFDDESDFSDPSLLALHLVGFVYDLVLHGLKSLGELGVFVSVLISGDHAHVLDQFLFELILIVAARTAAAGARERARAGGARGRRGEGRDGGRGRA